MNDETYLNITSSEEDPYTLKVSGQIRPVAAMNKYDFTPLVDSLIEQGYSKKEAHDIVRGLCREIVEELTRLQKGD